MIFSIILSIQSFRACSSSIVFEKSRSFSLNSLIEFNISLMSWTSFFWFCCTVFSSWLILSFNSSFSSISFETCASRIQLFIVWYLIIKWRLFYIVRMGQECFLMSVFQAIVHAHLHAMLSHYIKLLWLVVQQAFDLRIVCAMLCVACFLLVQGLLIHCFRADFLAICDVCCNCFQVFTFKLFLYAKMILLIFLLFHQLVNL